MKTKTLAALAAMSVAASPLGGCASVFEGTSQDINVVTNPMGARCAFKREDGMDVGVLESTPGKLTVRKSKYDLTITCTKAGYQPAAYVNNSGTTAIFINQLREKIGVMFGSPETTTGGRALKFYASVRLDVRRIETLKDGTDMVGNRTRVKVVKNKVSPPFKQAEFDIIYGQGISREGGLIDMGVEHGFVRKAGAWYTYDGDQLGQGKENARTFLRDNPDLADELEKKIKEKLGVGPQVDKPADPVADVPVDF